MNSTQLDQVSFGHFSGFTKQLALPNISAHPHPSSSAFLYLLPPCLILLAVDIVAQYSNRQALIANSQESLNDKEEIDKLGSEVREGHKKIKDMDRKLALEKMNSKYLSRTLLKQRNFARHRQRLEAYNNYTPVQQQAADTDSPPRYTPETIAPPTTKSKKPTGIGAPFSSFCERLLFQNKIWKQQREIKALKIALLSMKTGGTENAFQAFCDRLILTNKIWKQQKEIESLVGEAEKLKRSRVAAVTRAAKQMVQDVRKERLTEEFVRDLIAELGECRKQIAILRTEHEGEIRELADMYRKDCQRMSKEVELLRLGQDARALEQKLSNEMESDLVERLSLAESRATQLDEQLRQPSMGYATEDAELLSEDELEDMSNMSTSTCVGSGGDRSPNVKSTFYESSDGKMANHRARFRRVQASPLKVVLRHNSSSSLRISPGAKPPSIGKLEPVPYAGFSFNPLFFNSPTTTRSDDTTETESHQWRAGPPKNTLKSTAEQPKRVQWRF